MRFVKMGKNSKKKGGVEDSFPTAQARKAADDAIDSLDPKLPMTAYIDEWYIAYVAAGGRIIGKW